MIKNRLEQIDKEETRKIYFDGGGYRKRICIVDPQINLIKVRKLDTRRKLNSCLIEWMAFQNALTYANNYLNGSKKVQIIGDSNVLKSNFSSWRIGKTPGDKVRNACHGMLNKLRFKTNVKLILVRRNNNLAGKVLDEMKRGEKNRLSTWKTGYYFSDRK